jgi:NTE family protein
MKKNLDKEKARDDKKVTSKKQVALAIQGGGFHGAFAWGFIEALLADGRIEIEGFSGTSAGALNAVATADGYLKGGKLEAIKSLKNIWFEIHRKHSKNLMTSDPWGNWLGNFNLRNSILASNPGIQYFLKNLSPYISNPFNYSPFQELFQSTFNFSNIQKATYPKLFLAATNIQEGTIKIFENPEISFTTLMASSCIPMFSQAVEIEGEYYWDGGFVANPAIYPLIYGCKTKDIIVLTNIRTASTVPIHDIANIRERNFEIMLNACLMREISAIRYMTNLIDKGQISDPRIRRINLHHVKDTFLFAKLNWWSAVNADWDFLLMLHSAGLKAGKNWISHNFDKLGSDIPFPEAVYNAYL